MFQLSAWGDKQIVLTRWDEIIHKNMDLRSFAAGEALKPGQNYELELRAVGTALTVKFNGDVLGTVTDTALSEGRFGVGRVASDPNTQPSLVKSIEVLDLSAASNHGKASLKSAEPIK